MAEIHETMQSASKTVDQPYFNEIPLYSVSELGLPKDQINVDLKIKDISAFWEAKLRYLYIILGFCAVYFLGVLFDGGFFSGL